MKSTKHFPVVIEVDEDGVYIFSCPIIPGCHSYGSTVEEGMNNMAEAIEACLEDGEIQTTSRFVGVRDLQLAV